jgi:proteasome alpha subunit
VAMQFYASPDQIMRDRSEYARKGITKGRSVVVLSYADGVLFVAENVSKALHKVSEIYDRIGFAAVGKYNEFENLRAAGVRMADLRGYSYDRRDVTGRAITTAFAQTLGSIFTTETKPFEVEICIAEVGATSAQDELYRITYDGQAQDEPGFLAMGGQVDALATVLRTRHSMDMSLTDGLRLAVEALASIGGEGGKPRVLDASLLEVAVLDRARPGRKFRRLTGAALTPLLGPKSQPAIPADGAAADGVPADGVPADGASTDEPTAKTATTDKPVTDKAATDKPATDKAATDKAATDKPATDKPVAEKPVADSKLAAEKATKPAESSDDRAAETDTGTPTASGGTGAADE